MSTAVLPTTRDRFALPTRARLGWVVLLGSLTALVGLAVGELVAGPLSDALGRRAPLLAGLALHLAASVRCALAVAGDLFDGAGASRLIGRLLLVVGVSPVLAPTLGAQVLRVVDWRGIFAVLAAAAVLLAVVVALRLPETLPAERRRPAGVRGTAGTYRTLLGDRATGALVLVVGLTSSVIFSFVAVVLPALRRERPGPSDLPTSERAHARALGA